jgi:hypothetical protein
LVIPVPGVPLVAVPAGSPYLFHGLGSRRRRRQDLKIL